MKRVERLEDRTCVVLTLGVLWARVAASARALRRASGRFLPGSPAVDRAEGSRHFLTREGPQSRVSREFVAALLRAYTRNQLDLAGGTEHLRDSARWHTFVDGLFHTDWVVYAKPPFGGAAAVLRDLGRYTHRGAISNHRFIAFDGASATFRWKDYAHGSQWRTMMLPALEFLRRFVQHALPRGFVRIRQFGYLANACPTARLALACRRLAQPPTPAQSGDAARRTRCDMALSPVRHPMTVDPIFTAHRLAAVCLLFDSS